MIVTAISDRLIKLIKCDTSNHMTLELKQKFHTQLNRDVHLNETTRAT